MNPEVETLVAKLRTVAQGLSASGPIALLGLFLRDDSPDRWDLVIAAPWANSGSIKTIVSRLDKVGLSSKERILLSRIVTLPPDAPQVKAINAGLNVKNGRLELQSCYINGVAIKHAFIRVELRTNLLGPSLR